MNVEDIFKLTELGTNVNFTNWQQLVELLKDLEANQPSIKPPQSNVGTSLQKLESLLGKNGAVLKKIKFQAGEDDEGNGVVSTMPINKGDLVLGVPLNLMITAVTDESRMTGRNAIFKNSTTLQSHPDIALAFTLWQLLIQENPSAIESAYFDILPRKFDLPIWYSWEEICLLKRSSYIYTIYMQYNAIVRMYLALYMDLAADPTYKHELSLFSWSSFKTCLSIVLSRANAVPIGRDKSLLALIPGFDLFNHSYSTERNTFYDVTNKMFCISAAAAYLPNQHVTMIYGRKSVSDAFLNMGFIPPESQLDFLVIPATLSSKDGNSGLKSQLYKKHHLKSNGVYHLKLEDLKQDFTSNLIFKLLCIKLANPSQLEALLNDKIDVQLQQTVLKWLKCWLEILVATAKTSLSQLESNVEYSQVPNIRKKCIKSILNFELDLSLKFLKLL